MSENRDFFERILFPTYEEQIADYDARQIAGIKALNELGFNVGDTVYMDATLPAVIESATIVSGITQYIQVFVSLDPAIYAEYTGNEKPNAIKVKIPCHVENFWKAPLTGDDLKRWHFLKKYGLQHKMRLDSVPDKAIKSD